jgi:hypothetical protein
MLVQVLSIGVLMNDLLLSRSDHQMSRVETMDRVRDLWSA